MKDKVLLNKEDLDFLIYHLRGYIRDKDNALEECDSEDKKHHWDRLFRVTESKEVLKRVEEACFARGWPDRPPDCKDEVGER